MTPTPADLAAALETVRRNTQRPPGSPGRSLEYAEYTDACELLARWLAENAGRLRVETTCEECLGDGCDECNQIGCVYAPAFPAKEEEK